MGVPVLRLVVMGLLAAAPAARAGTPHHPEVLIYYASETALDESEAASWETILGWLDGSDHPNAVTMAEELRLDRAEFHRAIDVEIGAIDRCLPKARGTLSAVVFTNRLVRAGSYRLYRAGRTVEVVPIDPLPSDNLILVSNPLARPDMLARCLAEAARQFDPAAHRFLLITSGHGNAEMALTPRVVVRADETDREELLAVVSEQLPADQLPAWTHRIGVTKDEYFTVLAEAGRQQGMQFALVFMGSCVGILDKMRVRVPDNVARLYMTGYEGTEYSNADYADLLQRYDARVPFSTLMGEDLAAKFPTLVRGKETPGIRGLPWHLALWWSPLLLWLAWTARRWRLRR